MAGGRGGGSSYDRYNQIPYLEDDLEYLDDYYDAPRAESKLRRRRRRKGHFGRPAWRRSSVVGGGGPAANGAPPHGIIDSLVHRFLTKRQAPAPEAAGQTEQLKPLPPRNLSLRPKLPW